MLTFFVSKSMNLVDLLAWNWIFSLWSHSPCKNVSIFFGIHLGFQFIITFVIVETSTDKKKIPFQVIEPMIQKKCIAADLRLSYDTLNVLTLFEWRNTEKNTHWTFHHIIWHCLKSERFLGGPFSSNKDFNTHSAHILKYIDKPFFDPWCSQSEICHSIHFCSINALNSLWKLFESLNQIEGPNCAHRNIVCCHHIIIEIRLSEWMTNDLPNTKYAFSENKSFYIRPTITYRKRYHHMKKKKKVFIALNL